MWPTEFGRYIPILPSEYVPISSLYYFILGEFIRDLVALKSGGSGGVVWRIRASATKLVCAVGSRNGTEETKLLVLDFDAPLEK